jgi:hypothetical protein
MEELIRRINAAVNRTETGRQPGDEQILKDILEATQELFAVALAEGDSNSARAALLVGENVLRFAQKVLDVE